MAEIKVILLALKMMKNTFETIPKNMASSCVLMDDVVLGSDLTPVPSLFKMKKILAESGKLSNFKDFKADF